VSSAPLRLGLSAFALALAWTAASPVEALATPGQEVLVFHGNVALSEEIYRAIVDLPPNAVVSATVAHRVRLTLLEFLHRAGYDLAAVRTSVADNQIHVTINEGRLDKILFLNEGAYDQIRLKLVFSLPQNVFNRLILERQLKEMSKQFGLTDYHWLLVPTARPEHYGPQIERLQPIPNLDLIPPESGYELHVELSRREWESGVGLDASINGLEGVGVGGHYRDSGLIFDGDRWETNMRIAGNIREKISTATSEPVLSAGLLEARWFTPPLVGDYFRSYLDFRGYYLNRQRPDIGLDAFNYLSFQSSLSAEFAFIREFSLSIGAGVEHVRVFGLDPLANVSPIAREIHPTRLFAVLKLGVVFNPEQIRRDRKHTIDLDAWSYQNVDDRRSYRRVSAGYQKDTLLGWHELWIRGRATMLWDDVQYPDEEALGGDYLRGPFAGAFYLRKIAGAQLELRISLVRDLFKVSIFHDLAVFGAQSPDRTTEKPAAANAFGLGSHVLIIDAFQLDAYFGVGFATDGGFDKGFVLAIRQAY
jgi:hypothetical protein